MSIGVTGLQSARVNLATVGHNTTNSNTVGYSRQRAVQSTNIAVQSGSGYIGQGSHVSTVERVYNSFLTKQVNTTQSATSGLEAYYAELSKIDNMLADSSSGLSTALQDFFTGVNDLAANPALSSSRQSMVASAQALASRFQAINGQLNALYDGVNSQLASNVASVNTYAQQVASLNEQITIAQAAASGQPPNDLLDQRDQLITELNKLVAVTANTDSNGNYNVFFGTGQQLVVGTQVTTLEVKPSSSDISRNTIYLKSSGGSQELPESLITGGSLSGLLTFRSESLDKVSNELGRNAATLALTFNAQHALGQDGRGAIATDPATAGFVKDFFTAPRGRVLANSNNPAASPTVSISLTTPTTAANYTNLTGSDYRLSYDGANVTLTRLSDNAKWPKAPDPAVTTVAALFASPSLVAEPQGFSLASVGAFTAGTSATYLIQPTRNAASEIAVNPSIAADNTRVAAALPIRTSTGSSNTGKATISPGSVTQGYTAPTSGSPVSLTYDSTTNALTVSPGVVVTVTSGGTSTTYAAGAPVPYASGATISFSGISFEITGTPNDNDTFSIARNTGGTSDGRNALALGKLQTQKTMTGGTATYQSSYAALVSDIGNKTREIKSMGDAQQALLDQATDARASVQRQRENHRDCVKAVRNDTGAQVTMRRNAKAAMK
jgi:flagellar hook-associated protein 1 FlgK